MIVRRQIRSILKVYLMGPIKEAQNIQTKLPKNNIATHYFRLYFKLRTHTYIHIYMHTYVVTNIHKEREIAKRECTSIKGGWYVCVRVRVYDSRLHKCRITEYVLYNFRRPEIRQPDTENTWFAYYLRFCACILLCERRLYARLESLLS